MNEGSPCIFWLEHGGFQLISLSVWATIFHQHPPITISWTQLNSRPSFLSATSSSMHWPLRIFFGGTSLGFFVKDLNLSFFPKMDQNRCKPNTIIHGSSKCVKFVPFHPKNIPKGRFYISERSRYAFLFCFWMLILNEIGRLSSPED